MFLIRFYKKPPAKTGLVGRRGVMVITGGVVC